MPKLAAPSFNGVNIPADLRRVLEASMRPAAAALNKALVVGDSVQTWGPFTVTGTGAGAGVTGSGTTGGIPKWTSSTALGDSGATIDGNNRLAVPVGIAFPGGSTLDAAPAGVTGSASANQIAYWSSSSAIAGHSGFTYDGAGNSTLTGQATVGKMKLTDATNPSIYDAAGNKRIDLASDGRITLSGWRNGGSVYLDADTTITTNAQFLIARYLGSERFSVTRDGDGHFVGALAVAGASTLTGKISQGFTDSRGTPGAATINKPTGKSAIAASATSVVITNSLVTAASEVIITPLSIDAPAKWSAVPTSGSFTVTVDAAPAAAWAFSWWVLN